jgi:hypothetical protein
MAVPIDIKASPTFAAQVEAEVTKLFTKVATCPGRALNQLIKPDRAAASSPGSDFTKVVNAVQR